MKLDFGDVVFDASASRPVTVMSVRGENVEVKWLSSKNGDEEIWTFATSSLKDLEEFDQVRWAHREAAQEALHASEQPEPLLEEEQLELPL
jgi:hypothetical protein